MTEREEPLTDEEVQCIGCGDWVDSVGAEEGDYCSDCIEDQGWE